MSSFPGCPLYGSLAAPGVRSLINTTRLRLHTVETAAVYYRKSGLAVNLFLMSRRNNGGCYMGEAHGDYSRLAEAVSRLGLHEHLCAIYDTQEEQFAAALPWLTSSLERGEKCLYIVDENTAAAVLDALRKGGTDVDLYLRSGALTIARKEETCLEQGRFEPDWMIGFLTEAIAEGGAARLSRVRTILSEMAWALCTGNGTARLIEYQSKLNRFFRDHDARGICQYDRRLFSPELLLDVIRTHPVVVSGGMVSKNPYYVPPDEFLKPHQAERELERLLHNIQEWERTQQALRQSEDHLRLVIDTIPTMAWTVLPDGTLDFLNKRWIDYAGISLEQLEPPGPIHPEDIPRVLEKWRLDSAAGGPSEDEMRLRRADGEYRWFLVRTVPLRDERGNLVKWYGSSIDIEDRKRAEDDLRRQKEMLQKIFDNAPAMIPLRGPDGKMTFANREFERTLGCTLEAAALWPDLDLSGSETKSAELRVCARDGRVIETSWGKVHLSDGADLYIGRDITERKQTEDRLREYEKAVEGLEEMIVVVDRQYRYLIANRAFLSYMGVEREQLIGRFIKDMTNPGVFEVLVRARLDECLRGNVVKYELKYFYPARGERDLSVSYFPIEGAAGIDRVACVLQDITERKQAEEALRTLSGRILTMGDEERRRLARDLHDTTAQSLVALRMNLSVVNASAGGLNKRQREALAQSVAIADESLREIRTVSYLLHPPELDELGLKYALSRYIDGFMQRSGIRVDIGISPDLGRLPQLVETTVFRVVQECLTNAHRHSGSDTACVRLIHGPSNLVLEVEDTGHGIRTDAPSGVGIASMRERLQQVNGRLETISQSGGTVIRATIPL
jgi:PAS domain S-box-containing protein